MKKYIPLCHTSDSFFKKVWVDSCEERQKQHDQWVDNLRHQGIVAAHPDDGWVNREKNIIQLVFPYFGKNAVTEGALVALGTPEQWRVVTITRKINVMFGYVKWEFIPFWSPHS